MPDSPAVPVRTEIQRPPAGTKNDESIPVVDVLAEPVDPQPADQ